MRRTELDEPDVDSTRPTVDLLSRAEEGRPSGGGSPGPRPHCLWVLGLLEYPPVTSQNRA